MLIWAAATVLTLTFFLVMSWQTMSIVRWPAGAGANTPTPTPVTATPTPRESALAHTTPAADAAATATALAGLAVAPTGVTQATAGDDNALIALWLSAISAITTLLGLISTTWLNWRREQRDMLQAQAELEKTRLEVAKLQAELANRAPAPDRHAPRPVDVEQDAKPAANA